MSNIAYVVKMDMQYCVCVENGHEILRMWHFWTSNTTYVAFVLVNSHFYRHFLLPMLKIIDIIQKKTN